MLEGLGLGDIYYIKSYQTHVVFYVRDFTFNTYIIHFSMSYFIVIIMQICINVTHVYIDLKVIVESHLDFYTLHCTFKSYHREAHRHLYYILHMNYNNT